MGTKRALEQRLSDAEVFTHPRLDLEQYPTPPDVAAHTVHLIDITGDLRDRIVVDLGTGPGILAIGCAHREPACVIGVEIDRDAIEIARTNERTIAPPMPIEWINADATRAPLRRAGPTTVIMNPPFGAQGDNVHVDRAFLATAAELADVSYSFHNAGSQAFVDGYASSRGGQVTAGMAVEFELTHQFPFHEAERTTIPAELFRIEWRTDHADSYSAT